MTSRQGFVTIMALFFLILLSGILLFQLEGYHRQMEAYNVLIQHYEQKLRTKSLK
ncbi:hypothetical protein HC026_04595 [Lactobacillus sp. LC28-10]|uniref:Uncharacterized protein n=1 Tax=Secundilactobacillus angelensis TaxID=2722706 RepID=A0ABX1KZG9_9LACO|nr:hypothetical protein [Secundilactobacillus angelensis]MCH5462606.1 hypothetical protein [Secundilactobacillus angelensis]NLR18203.1 hypothetical protein [Secundilactobacillus angelensis]